MFKGSRFGANQLLMTLAVLAAALAAGSRAGAYETCAVEADWQYICETEANWSVLSDIEDDSSGNFIAGGAEFSPTLVDKWRVDKVDAKGNLMWTDLWSLGPDISAFVAWNVEIEPDNEILVAGAAINSNIGVLRKYAPDGEILWTFTTESGYYPALAASLGGTAFLATSLPHSSMQTIRKFSHDGIAFWSKDVSLGGPITDMEMIPNGDIVAVIASYPSFKVVRLDPYGNIRWEWEGDSWLYFPSVDIVVDAERHCFYLAHGTYGTMHLLKFDERPGDVSYGVAWIAEYPGFCCDLAISFSMDLDSMGNLWAPFNSGGGRGILQFDTVSDPDQSPPIACIKTEYDWIRQGGFLRGHVAGPQLFTEGVACSRDGGLAVSGAMDGMGGILKLSQVRGGPVAKGNPTGPGADHENGMKPGDVRAVAGSRGFVDPRRGEGAAVSAYPASAGTVTLTVIDRKGGIVKQISGAASGSGAITLTWDGKNGFGAPVAPGIYSMRIEGPGIRQLSRIAVVY